MPYRGMSYSVIRQWAIRLGYGILHQAIAKRQDWVYLLDYSISIGTQRCLLILGVTQESLSKHGYCLSHHQVEVLDIYISSTHQAQQVYQRLEYCATRTGVPTQIICDNGSDVRKGTALFIERYAQVVRTYDITHKIGSLLKTHLKTNENWLSLQADLSTLSQQTKQSKVSFLRPLSLSQKSRWLNIDKIVNSLSNIYKYQARADFHLIESGFRIKNAKALVARLPHGKVMNNKHKKLIKLLSNTVFEQAQLPKLSAFEHLAPFSQHIEWIDAGQLIFEQKFARLAKHKKFIQQLERTFNFIRKVKNTITTQGLSLDTIQQIEQYEQQLTFYPKWARNLFQSLNNYLIEEHAKFGICKKAKLICSDVIESIFGKFKAKINTQKLGLHQAVLLIPLFCNQLSDQSIQQILQNNSYHKVQQWIQQMAGQSLFAKRLKAFYFT